jgi:hypothetical protein
LRILDAPNVAVEILQTECKLVRVDAFGAASELHSLQLLDDGFEAPDLGVAMVNRSGNVAHQALQKLRIGWEIGEIELHVQWYSNQLPRRRISTQFRTGFCRSSCNRRLPNTLWCAPVDAFDQHRRLRRRERDRAIIARHHRPHEAALVDAFAEQAQPVAVPEQDLQYRCLLAAEGKQMTGERILLQRVLHQHREPIHALRMSV